MWTPNDAIGERRERAGFQRTEEQSVERAVFYVDAAEGIVYFEEAMIHLAHRHHHHHGHLPRAFWSA